MTVETLWQSLQDQGIELWVEGDRLRWRAPKGAVTAALRTTLSEYKPQFLALVRNRQALKQPRPPLRPVARNQPLPLSYAQQGLWLLDRLNPDNTAYNISGLVRLTGLLHENALEQSFAAIVQRHEILRTRFVESDGEPRQIIESTVRVRPIRIDLQGLPSHTQDQTLEALASAEAQQPFDLGLGPLLRVVLIKLASHDHAVLFTVHHIAFDDYSTSILLRELALFYTAYSTGRTAQLAILPLQYADFAYWQRQWLQGEVLEAYVAYWRQKLSHDLPTLQLPTDRPRQQTRANCGAIMPFTLSPELTEAIRALSQKQGVTLFITLLSAFQILLQHYTGQNDIVIGTNFMSRQESQLEDLIGFFVNTLVLRVDISGDPTFTELLERVRTVVLEVYTHQDLPFELLVNQIRPKRNINFNSLFQVMFVLQNEEKQHINIPGLQWNVCNADSGASKFDLTLFMRDSVFQLNGAFEYNSQLFNRSTIRRAITHLNRLLTSIVANPGANISKLSVVPYSEAKSLIDSFNEPI